MAADGTGLGREYGAANLGFSEGRIPGIIVDIPTVNFFKGDAIVIAKFFDTFASNNRQAVLKCATQFRKFAGLGATNNFDEVTAAK